VDDCDGRQDKESEHAPSKTDVEHYSEREEEFNASDDLHNLGGVLFDALWRLRLVAKQTYQD
jgi:hypothetical protein